jgi:hypothetical protein
MTNPRIVDQLVALAAENAQAMRQTEERAARHLRELEERMQHDNYPEGESR